MGVTTAMPPKKKTDDAKPPPPLPPAAYTSPRLSQRAPSGFSTLRTESMTPTIFAA